MSPAPGIFRHLTLYEKCCIAPLHASMKIIRLKYNQLALSGHTIVFGTDMYNFTRSIPKIQVPIILVGRLRADGKLTQMRCRRQRILDCINYF